jgi:hypothetical protein
VEAAAYLRTWRMRWDPLVWRTEAVPARSEFAELRRVRTDYSPCDIDVNGCDDRSEISNLVLAFPILEIIDIASPADIEVLARLDHHVACGDYEGDRRLFWVISGDPDCDWDVVGSIPERYW